VASRPLSAGAKRVLNTILSQCFPQGTIAITIAANIADTALLAEPMYFPDSVVGAVVHTDSNLRFIELCIRRSKRRLDAIAPQSAQKNINLQDLRPLLLPYPSKDEQDAISARVDAVQNKIDVVTRDREKLRLKKLGLMQDLLTGRVPVPATPEPAEAAA
jgi:type I restriction enzyme S subunit